LSTILVVKNQMNTSAFKNSITSQDENIEQWLAPRLGARLSMHRKERGWTQAYLAEKLGVETETISRFERGHAMPSLKRLACLAEILDAPLSDLLGSASSLPSDLGVELSEMLRPLTNSQRTAVLEAMRLLIAQMHSTSGPEVAPRIKTAL
jgi:transcriptional regulator with XRE-family HTH domain